MTPPKDSDPFPFGKYKDQPYEKVPASYLDWLSGQDWIKQWPDVQTYIRYNRAVIDAEMQDEIGDVD